MEAARLMLVDRLGSAAASRGEELLAEIPAAVRRLGLLMLVLAFSVPVFLAGCLGVLAWWLLA
jgi:hypothetical protein